MTSASNPAADEQHRQRTSLTAWWLTAGTLLAIVGGIAYACAVAVDHACYHAPPPISIPDISTPRGHYCAHIENLHLWRFLIGVPLLATGLALAVSWRRIWPAVILATLIAGCAIANAIVANQLTWALTI